MRFVLLFDPAITDQAENPAWRLLPESKAKKKPGPNSKYVEIARGEWEDIRRCLDTHPRLELTEDQVTWIFKIRLALEAKDREHAQANPPAPTTP